MTGTSIRKLSINESFHISVSRSFSLSLWRERHSFDSMNENVAAQNLCLLCAFK